VSQLFVWRIAPFSDVYFQLLACAGVARLLLNPRGRRQYTPVACTTAILGAGFLVTYYGFVRQPALPTWALWILLGLLGAQLAERSGAFLRKHRVASGVRRFAASIAPLVLLVLAAWVWWEFAATPVRHFRQRSNLIQGLDRDEAALFSWVRENTPRDAIFITPPSMERFRLDAQRAIIVDWKSPPLAPAELVEWYRRLCHVSGNPEVSSLNAAEAGYRRMDAQRLEALSREYGAPYAVFNGVLPHSLRGYRRLFSNGRYTVLQISG
jgi:hypothetical protein